MWDGLVEQDRWKTYKVPKNAVRWGCLRTADQHKCRVYLTENELYWDTGLHLSDDLHNKVDLRDVAFAAVLYHCHEIYTLLTDVKLRTSAWDSLVSSYFDRSFIVGIVVRNAKHQLVIRELIFTCEQEKDTHDWVDHINTQLKRSPTRPKQLLVFVNPNSGRKQAERIYFNNAAPLFNLVGITTKVIVTTHRGHATEYLLENAGRVTFDGIVCVGGDGFLSEVVQGLLLFERLKANLPLFEEHHPGDVELPSPVHIGTLSAGSTDTIAYSTQGTNDLLTSMLNIITGASLAVDVAAIHCADTGRFIRYAVSMTAYGFHADLLKNDDKLRWMGPRRYDCSGFTTFMQHAVYNGEISYLPSFNRSSHSADGVLCHSGCRVCATDFSAPARLNEAACQTTGSPSTSEPSNSARQTRFYLDDQLSGDEAAITSTSVVTPKTGTGTHLFPPPEAGASRNGDVECDNSDPHRVFTISSAPSLPLPMKTITTQSPSWTIQGCPRGWQTVSGAFVAINAFLQSCRCLKAASGPAPWAHLGDGCLDLVLVRNCSRRRFLQFLWRTAHNRSQFALPFVSVARVCAFTFRARPPDTPCAMDRFVSRCCRKRDSEDEQQSEHASLGQSRRRIVPPLQPQSSLWCADGEVIRQTDISVFVHRKLIRLYSNGPDLS